MCNNKLCFYNKHLAEISFSRLFFYLKLKLSRETGKQMYKLDFIINILLYVINDQTCLANYNMKAANILSEIFSSYFSRYPAFEQFCLDFHQKNISLMINPIISNLQKFSSFTLKETKMELNNTLDIKNSTLEMVLKQIADFDKKTKRFYLKSQFQNKYINPFNSYFNDSKDHDFKQGLRQRFETEQVVILSNLGVQENIIFPSYIQSLKSFVLKRALFEKVIDFFTPSEGSDHPKIDKIQFSVIRLINEGMILINQCNSNENSQSQDFSQLDQQKQELFKQIQKLIEILKENQKTQKFNDELSICFKHVCDQFYATSQKFTNNNNEEKLILIKESENKKITIMKKKEELLKKFQQKQKIFEKKFGQNFDQQEDIKLDQIQGKEDVSSDKLECNFCRQQLALQPDNQTQFWGYCAYASISNASDYLKFQKQDRQLNQFKFDDQFKKLLQSQQKSLLQKISTNGTYCLQTCQHPIHQECYLKVLSSTKQVFLLDGEFLCPLCKGLSNIFMPYIDLEENGKQDIKFSEFNFQKLEVLEQTVFEKQQPCQKQSHIEQVNEFIEKFTLIPYQNEYQFNKSSNQKDLTLEFQDSIVQTVINMIDFLQNQNFNKQIGFLKNQIRILKVMNQGCNQIFQNFKMENQSFLQQIKQENPLLHKEFKNDSGINIEKQIDQIEHLKINDNLNQSNENMEEENEWQSESDSLDQSYESFSEELIIENQDLLESPQGELKIDYSDKSNHQKKENQDSTDIEKNLLKYIIIFCSTYKIDEKSILALQDMINRFVFFRIIQLLLMDQIVKDQNLYINFFEQKYEQLKNIKIDCQTLMETIENPIKYGIISDNIKQLDKKIKLMLLLFSSIDDKKIYLDITQDNQVPFQYFGLNQSSFIKLQDQLQIQFVQIPFDNFFIDHREDINQNSFVSLKEDWAQISSHYIHSRCSLCKDLPQGGIKQVMCLLCEKIMCSSVCKKTESRNKIGNLNYHCVQYHQGQSIFLSLSDSQILTVKSPLNNIYGGLYINQYGEEFKSKYQKWNEFEVDKSSITLLYKKLIFGELGADIVHKMLRDNIYYRQLTF